ncbi:hemolysin family protein [Dysgonomonas sp. ZJ709]|uniref:hemolysin family protein n=1 Tax=Dysgonomonas sp. ZJ709 TaxID=2709797 RepID=UPI0013EA012C|nr:hemolysin family protein [Dysgonomonas sp. ZJ709]
MEIIIIIALILLNGIFSMSEMSLVTSRKFKLENAKKKGSKGAKTALELSENPARFLSTVQIGITLIGILLGIYSGEKLTGNLVGFLNQFDAVKPYAHDIAVTIIVVCVTFLSIVLGELLPKRLGMAFPERIAIILAKPMKILSVLTTPFVWLLTVTNDLLLKIIGLNNTADDKISEEEIKSIIRQSAEGGEIQEIEQDIVERVFELGDRKVSTLLTHRGEIVFFNTTDTWDVVKNKINEEKHSAYPVCKKGNLDDILGLVLLKNLFPIATDQEFNINDFVTPALFLNENMYAYKVLELFRKEKIHYGIVIDEYGATVGIVTMDDVVDALLGDISEIGQDEYQIIQRDENSWLVDGQYSFIEFMKYFDINPDNYMKGNFTTLAGLIISMNNTLPEVGERFIFDKYELEVVDKDGQRIDKVLVTKH